MRTFLRSDVTGWNKTGEAFPKAAAAAKLAWEDAPLTTIALILRD
jgi:hypothetical protein